MKATRVGSVEGARLTQFVTLARGHASLTLPIAQVPDLLAVINEVVEGEAHITVAPAPRRGQLWKAARAFLESSPRAISFRAILQAVAPGRGDELAHSLRVVLGRRVAAGDVTRTDAGRYRLAPGARPDA